MEVEKKKKRIFLKIMLILLIIIIGFLFYVAIIPRLSLIGKSTDYKVYIALGFHGNLYHSFRGNTNDEEGFGKDIRIIRKIIKVMDEYNKKDIDVKAVWDIENLFSLGDWLPKYAPDIIENLKRRVKENNDEVILMSYNNALASALTEEELRLSIENAITNDKKSGIEDIFKKWTPVVRPQEVMTTPGNFKIYKEYGLDTVSLYYSAITFDAIRTFIRELTLEEAHNPLLYKNKETNEETTIIPTYNIGDLIENVSLKNWVKKLHREQLRGNIKRDLLIFINFDADNDYWYGYDLPGYLSWLPNAGGLPQLIESVSEIDYVKFTTLGEYLKEHETVGEISFGQDTADGCFNGYNSWAEKAGNHETWTEVIKNRDTHNLINKIYSEFGDGIITAHIKNAIKNSIEKRLRLLSTTNFGLAAPFLARERETEVKNIVYDMKSYTVKAREDAENYIISYLDNIQSPNIDDKLKLIEPFMLINKENKEDLVSYKFLNINIDKKYINKTNKYLIYSKDSKLIDTYTYGIYNTEEENIKLLKLYIPNRKVLKDGVYFLYISESENTSKDYNITLTKKTLKNEYITITFTENGLVDELLYNGVSQVDKNSLIPSINYNNKIYTPGSLNILIENDGSSGVGTLKLSGDFILPVEGSRPGRVEIKLSLISGVPYLFSECDIKYPETPLNNIIKSNKPLLIRKYDNDWIEVSPYEINFIHKADIKNPFKILKRNYLGVSASYEVDYYKHSDENLNLANINNHITAEFVALAGKEKGIAIAMDNSLLSNFAFCPMKMNYSKEDSNFSMKLNPFGTYFGEQYYQPTWGNRQGFEMTNVEGEQYKSSAPTYNGYEYKFFIMLSFFDGRVLTEELKNDLIGFADSPNIINKIGTQIQNNYTIEVLTDGKYKEQIVFKKPSIQTNTPNGFIASYSNKGVIFHWEYVNGYPGSFKIYCGEKSSDYNQVYDIDGNKVSEVINNYQGKPFELGKTYFAKISSFSYTGEESPLSEEISFTIEKAEDGGGPSIPFGLQLKILLFVLKSMID